MEYQYRIRNVNKLQLRDIPNIDYFDDATDSEDDACHRRSDEGSNNDQEYKQNSTHEECDSEELETELVANAGQTTSTLVTAPKNEGIESRSERNTNLLEQKDQRPSERLHLPAGRNGSENVSSPMEAWSLLINDEIHEIVIRHTNELITMKRATSDEISEGDRTYSELTSSEFRAFLGLLHLSGLNEDGHKNTEELWSNFSSPLYPATMSHTRFKFILSCLRFDETITRRERRSTDEFAPIREIWDLFLTNCKKYYTPHRNCNVNEQLIPFHGRCAFRAYMKNEPHKYGIKLLMLNDATTHYMMNAIPYVRLVPNEAPESVSSYYLRKLTEPIHDCGRNITCTHDLNSTIGGSNKKLTFNHLCGEYSTARETRRWPLRIFFAMLDQSVINSFILYLLNADNESMKRARFIENLVINLTKPYIQERMYNGSIRSNLKLLMYHLFDIEMPDISQHDIIDCKLEKRKRCVHCNGDRKTQHICPRCKRPRCEEHRSLLCVICTKI